MALISYIEKNFRAATLNVIDLANTILEDFIDQGFVLGSRQLYYQFVARDVFPEGWIDPAYNRKHGLPLDTVNTPKNYKRLSNIIGDARLAGCVDWDAIEDRTRELDAPPWWENPADSIADAADQYNVNCWGDQPYYVEVWTEKETVLDDVCRRLRVPLMVCHGYNSLSEMHSAALRLRARHSEGQMPVILNFADHDPSGIDMTRDIADRMSVFGCEVQVMRLALTFPQIAVYDPPPNPAKVTDSRFKAYVQEFGEDSWELDALEPSALEGLVSSAVEDLRDEIAWGETMQREEEEREQLQAVADNWKDIIDR